MTRPSRIEERLERVTRAHLDNCHCLECDALKEILELLFKVVCEEKHVKELQDTIIRHAEICTDVREYKASHAIEKNTGNVVHYNYAFYPNGERAW